MKQIKNVKALQQSLAAGQRRFRILLNGGIYSRKTITASSGGRFHIVNHIDESVQRLTGRQLYTRSNIGEAMRKGAFVAETSENY
jgi:hypothetical protein